MKERHLLIFLSSLSNPHISRIVQVKLLQVMRELDIVLTGPPSVLLNWDTVAEDDLEIPLQREV